MTLTKELAIIYGQKASCEQAVLCFDDFKDTGFRGAVVGSSGAGKSYAIRVLVEQFLSMGLPSIIFDPEGEYYSLAEKYPSIIVGGERQQIPLDDDPFYIMRLVELALSSPYATIFDLSEKDMEAQQDLFTQISGEIFKQKKALSGINLVVIEEAELFAPQHEKAGEALKMASTLARRGRKRGLWTLWAPHRSADFNKKVLSQCNWSLIGRLDDIRDFKQVEFRLPANLKYEHVQGLTKGQFYLRSELVTINQAQTTHVAGAIGAEVRLPEPSGDLSDALKSLAQSLQEKPEQEEGNTSNGNWKRASEHLASEQTALIQKIEQKDKQIEKLKHEIEQKNSQIRTLEEFAAVGRLLHEAFMKLPIDRREQPVVNQSTVAEALLQAPQFLRKQHLEKRRQVLLDRLMVKLSNVHRDILRYVIASGGKAPRQVIAERVTETSEARFTGRNVSVWHREHLTPLIQSGFISFGGAADKSVHLRLKEAVGMEFHGLSPADEDIDKMVAELEYLLAQESNE